MKSNTIGFYIFYITKLSVFISIALFITHIYLYANSFLTQNEFGSYMFILIFLIYLQIQMNQRVREYKKYLKREDKKGENDER